jgi:hypothetical protein
MARTRPQGRSKSDHRVCQAARHVRAADYRNRIEISAEKQEALIAAVNAWCDAEPAPRRRRGQKSKGEWAARGPLPVRPCRSSARATKLAKRHLAQSLGEPAAKGEKASFSELRLPLLPLRLAQAPLRQELRLGFDKMSRGWPIAWVRYSALVPRVEARVLSSLVMLQCYTASLLSMFLYSWLPPFVVLKLIAG